MAEDTKKFIDDLGRLTFTSKFITYKRANLRSSFVIIVLMTVASFINRLVTVRDVHYIIKMTWISDSMSDIFVMNYIHSFLKLLENSPSHLQVVGSLKLWYIYLYNGNYSCNIFCFQILSRNFLIDFRSLISLISYARVLGSDVWFQTDAFYIQKGCHKRI